MVSHLVQDFDDIDPDRTKRDAAAAADAHELVIDLDEILEFMQQTLPAPRGLVGPGVVTRGMHGEIGELAGVPGPDSLALEWGGGFDLIADIKAMTGRPKLGADGAAE